MPRTKTSKKETEPREPGGGRKTLSPAGPRIDRVSFRLDPGLAPRLEDYEQDVPDYSRTSTMNLALQLFLDVSELDEEETEEINRMIRKQFPDRYPRWPK